MPATPVSICSAALALLGDRPIAALTETTDRGRLCAALYPSFRESLLAMYPWRCTMRRRALARLTNAPLNEWRYAYQLPSERLGNIRAAYDTAGLNAPPVQDFEILGNQLQTNRSAIFVEYQVDVAESAWPAYLVKLAQLGFAAEIATSITDQVNAAELWTVRAWGMAADGGRGGYFAIAAGLDAQQQPPQQIGSDELIAVRFV